MLGSLSAYLDGELEAQFCEEIERHAGECGRCRIVVDTLQRTVTLYRDFGHDDLQGDVKTRLYAVLSLDPPGGEGD
jgi:anti-sigma factor RsiW